MTPQERCARIREVLHDERGWRMKVFGQKPSVRDRKVREIDEVLAHLAELERRLPREAEQTSLL